MFYFKELQTSSHLRDVLRFQNKPLVSFRSKYSPVNPLKRKSGLGHGHDVLYYQTLFILISVRWTSLILLILSLTCCVSGYLEYNTRVCSCSL